MIGWVGEKEVEVVDLDRLLPIVMVVDVDSLDDAWHHHHSIR